MSASKDDEDKAYRRFAESCGEAWAAGASKRSAALGDVAGGKAPPAAIPESGISAGPGMQDIQPHMEPTRPRKTQPKG